MTQTELLLTPLNDRWLRILGISLLVLLYVLSTGVHTQPLTPTVWQRIGLTLVITTVYWHVLRAVIVYVRSRYASKTQATKRLVVTFLIGVVVAIALSWLSGAARHWLANGTLTGYRSEGTPASVTVNNITFSLSLFGFDLLQAIITVVFYQTVYGTFFLVRDYVLSQKRLKEAEREQERLRTENLQSQLDALKQQVNPHFLFNSLNVLDSLIDEDPPQARLFLEELSTVYRYLLRSNRGDDGPDQNTTSLQAELDFIQSYFHLLKTRHGAGLSLSIDVPDAYQTYRLPPLTLQLLVENAVKHNIVLPDQPLHIAIQANGERTLQVRNTLQRKTVRVASNGVGLSNILTKYAMLNQVAPTIEEREGQFVVTLPLIPAIT